MDRDPNTTSTGGTGVLDDVFRQVTDEEQSWGRTHLHLPLGMRMRYMIWIHFLASNNVAEYEALVNGLHISTELGIQWLDVRGDS
jgi:ribonuclease HI